jgi:FMN-dependent NADH-azoreductase
MKVLHVSCGPRGQSAESYQLSKKIVGYLLKSEPTAVLINRVVGGGALGPLDESYATALGRAQESRAEVFPSGSMAQSDELIRELVSADFVVIGTPMHNFTIPSSLKTWIDHVVRVRRTFNATPKGKIGTLRDRPVFVAVSSGGRYSGERAHQPDFLTAYLKAVLGIVGLHDLTFFSVQGTGSDPDTVAAARAKTDQALLEYFSSFDLRQSIEAADCQRSVSG